MALFNKIKDTIAVTGQSAVKGAKDIAGSARLNSQIADEQKQIAILYKEIGEQYYQEFGEAADSPFKEHCEKIAAAFERIASLQQEIQQIKGVKSCAKCSTENPITAAFCVSCGSALEDATQGSAETGKSCANCGEELEAGVAFCPGCGQKVE